METTNDLTVQANVYACEGILMSRIVVELFHVFSSGSSYTDNLQPFDRTIASTMSIEKTDPNKVCMISGISPTLQGHPLGRAYSGQIKTRYQCLN